MMQVGDPNRGKFTGRAKNSDIANSMPRVYAFEIESNLRKLIEELLNPIVLVNKDNNSRLGNLE